MMMSRRWMLTATAATSLGAVASSRVPVLVELFTSEGCSSCPPADRLLDLLDRTQPVPSADIIVLSEHVDYWNHIGWTDPFSSALYSRRQQDYARRFRLDGVYTPQMVVDGRAQFVGSDEVAAAKSIATAAEAPKLPLNLEASGDRLIVKSAAPVPADAVICVVFAKEHAVSKVARGENEGRELRHVNVASRFVSAGLVRKGRTADAAIDLRSQTPDALRIIAFAQEVRSGQISAVGRL